LLTKHLFFSCRLVIKLKMKKKENIGWQQQLTVHLNHALHSFHSLYHHIGQLYVIKRWRWTSVLLKIMWFGVFYVMVNVGVAKLVTLFMSWLNGALTGLGLFFYRFIILVKSVCFLFRFWLYCNDFLCCWIGCVFIATCARLTSIDICRFSFFVYLTGGIILVKQGEELMTFWGATAFASAIVFRFFFLKISSILKRFWFFLPKKLVFYN